MHDVSRILSKIFLHPSLHLRYTFVSGHDSSRTSSPKNTFLNKQKSTWKKSSSTTLPSLFFLFLSYVFIDWSSVMDFLLMKTIFQLSRGTFWTYLNCFKWDFNGCRELPGLTVLTIYRHLKALRIGTKT